MEVFRKTCGYIFAVAAGLAAGVVLSLAGAGLALMIMLDPGTTEDELAEAKGRCELLLRTTKDRLEAGR
jgi:hypothetical protein